MHQLFGIISRVAVEPGEDASGNPIRKFNEHAVLVCLCKPALEDELKDCMAQLPAAVGENIWWGRDTKFLHICICKVVRQLERLGQNEQRSPVVSSATLPWGDMRGEMLETPMAGRSHTSTCFQRKRRLATETRFRNW